MIQDIVSLGSALVFPIFFVVMWLLGTSVLGRRSGWNRVADAYPDRSDEPILLLRFQSGMMGKVRMNGILTLASCAPGLRVAIPRLFGPFCRPFLVPWRDISVRPRSSLFGPMVELSLGDAGRLTLAANLAERLARASGRRWHEAEPLPVETHGAVIRRIVLLWAGMTGIAVVFFTVAPRLLGVAPGGEPVLAIILPPAVVFGIAALINYARDRPR